MVPGTREGRVSAGLSSAPRDRFFVEGRHALGDVVTFARDDAHKIVDVLRKSSGDQVVVIDSVANAFVASLEIEGRTACGRLDRTLETDSIESRCEIVLAQAIPKGQKMDYVVEKATELGAARIVPFHSSRSIAEVSKNKLERWRHLARSGAQQSGRLRVPEVSDPVGFAELLASIERFDITLFAWELATESLREALAGMAEAKTLLAIVGPEGGFSHEEASAASAAGARHVSLGRRILRAETAPLVLLTTILYESGEL